MPAGALTRPITANDTVLQERSWVGKVQVRNDDDIRRLVGKRYFVSRIIRGVTPFGSYKSAYRFHGIKGKVAEDAAMILEAMYAARIEMVERELEYPQSPDYLSCCKGLNESRILSAIEIICRFRDVPVPGHWIIDCY